MEKENGNGKKMGKQKEGKKAEKAKQTGVEKKTNDRNIGLGVMRENEKKHNTATCIYFRRKCRYHRSHQNRP